MIDADAASRDARRPNLVTLSEWDAAEFLSARQVPFVDRKRVGTPDEAARAASELGFPVVLKIDSPDILHKTEVDGVIVGLSSPEAVRAAAGELAERVRSARPRVRAAGFIVEPRLEGFEVLVGGLRDAQFGPVLMLGSGGIYAEVFGESACRLAPLTMEQARDMVAEMRFSRVLAGCRGRPAGDIAALCRLLVAVGDVLVRHHEIVELDLNPVFVFAEDQGCLAADALMIVDRAPDRASGEWSRNASRQGN